MEENLENGIKALLDFMIDSERKKSQELIKDFSEKIKASGIDLSNPESFNYRLVHKINRAIEELVHTAENTPSTKINTVKFVYLHYDFFHYHISNLCKLREGNSCSSDKSRAIIKMYLDYLITNKIPEFNPDEEIWFLPNFGDYNQWIALCDGLHSLYYGQPKDYFLAYKELVESEIRKYKHILHNWYIRFKDGEIINFNYTWDDNQKNPLDSDYYDKGDYYVLSKKYVKDRNYEEYLDDLLLPCCKVPKSDIKEIYKVSEEKMV